MDYGNLLTKAWRYLWRYKILWLFGVLNGCQTINASFSNDSGQAQVGAKLLERWASANESIVWIAIGIFVFSILVFILVSSIVGRIGIIRVTALAEAGREKIPLETIFADQWGSFWGLLAFSFLFGFITMVAWLILFGMPFSGLAILIINNPGAVEEDVGMALVGAILIALFFSLCIILPIAFLLMPFLQMSRNALVNEKIGIWSAMRNGWRMYRRNFGALILLAIILLILRFFLGILLVPAAMIFVLGVPLWFELFLILLGFLPFGWISAFIESVWTLAYLHLRQDAQIDQAARIATG